MEEGVVRFRMAHNGRVYALQSKSSYVIISKSRNFLSTFWVPVSFKTSHTPSAPTSVPIERWRPTVPVSSLQNWTEGPFVRCANKERPLPKETLTECSLVSTEYLDGGPVVPGRRGSWRFNGEVLYVTLDWVYCGVFYCSPQVPGGGSHLQVFMWDKISLGTYKVQKGCVFEGETVKVKCISLSTDTRRGFGS